jgi:hypothetical protein
LGISILSKACEQLTALDLPGSGERFSLSANGVGGRNKARAQAVPKGDGFT